MNSHAPHNRIIVIFPFRVFFLVLLHVISKINGRHQTHAYTTNLNKGQRCTVNVELLCKRFLLCDEKIDACAQQSQRQFVRCIQGKCALSLYVCKYMVNF